MSECGSDTSSLPDRPIYFRPFTRESLKNIKERMEEDAIKKAEETKKSEEVSKLPHIYLNVLQIPFVIKYNHFDGISVN